MGKKGAVSGPKDNLQSKAKERQAAKLAEIRDGLVTLGYDTTAKQAIALGVCRSTAWVLLNRDKKTGPKPLIIKRILASPNLPPKVRRIVKEYADEKIAGLYGHAGDSRRALNHQFRHRAPDDPEARTGASQSVQPTL